MKRIIITGASGLLGQYLVKNLIENYEILVVVNSHNPFKAGPNIEILQADLTSFQNYFVTLQKFAPDIIFNCAAYNDVDGSESNRELALTLNCRLVANLCRLDADRIVHFSTDYVFNGQSGPYRESDESKPLNYYGETKLMGEQALLRSAKKYNIIRSNVLFGHKPQARPNFATWVIESLKQGNPINVANDQYNNPIHAENLTKAACELLNSYHYGIINIAGLDYVSRYEFALKLAMAFQLNNSLIKPVPTSDLHQLARRPLRGGLHIDYTRNTLKTKLLGLNDAISLLKSELMPAGTV